ncbi:MAG: hypothetical protein V9H26_05020 [Verrucomicrobiota bacterium]
MEVGLWQANPVAGPALKAKRKFRLGLRRIRNEFAVERAPKVDSQDILSSHVGKKAFERQDSSMENLVVTVEE